MLSREIIEEVEREVSIFPDKRAGCIEALKTVQRHQGWVSDEALADLAPLVDMSPAELDNVATFYSLVFRRSVGRHVILVCDSVSCWVLGYDELRAALTARLGIDLGETSADGRFTLLSIPCLGACDHAPALMIDDDLHQDLAPETLERRLDDILKGYP